MSAAIHMHQTGTERGPDGDVGTSQLHYEGDRCVALLHAYRTIDLNVTYSQVQVEPASRLADGNPGGPWPITPESPLRLFLETSMDGTTWTWSESDAFAELGRQLPDGAAAVLMVGDYSTDQVGAMLAQSPSTNNSRELFKHNGTGPGFS